MMTAPRMMLAIGLLLAVSPAIGQVADGEALADNEPRTGIFTTRFDQRSAQSRLDSLADVGRWPRAQMDDWDLDEIEFQMVVPEGYDGSEAYGLLVFIHPFDDVDAENPRAFFYGRDIQEILAEHKLIWVSFDDGGNQVQPPKRIGLALDAAHNAADQYNIDPNRVYVSGMSGGGRMTSMAAIYFSEVFKGSIAIVGSCYFRDIPLPNDEELRAIIRPDPEDHTHWPRRLLRPSRRALDDMKENNRFVLLTGSTDYNMPEMRMTYERGFDRDAFEHAHYLEVPGMGHAFPDAEWFERAVVLLDAPLQEGAPENSRALRRNQERAQQRLDAAQALLERDLAAGADALGRLIDRYPDTDAAQTARNTLEAIADDPERAAQLERAQDERQAKRLLELARNFINSDDPINARAKLELLLETYPDSPQADQAQQMLDRLR